jgi:hypothetical protein
MHSIAVEEGRENETQVFVHHFVGWKRHHLTPVCGQVLNGSTCHVGMVNKFEGQSNAKNASKPIVDA